MRIWVGIAVLCISSVFADLPSCERARCVHCEVEFIARMCPIACGSCTNDHSIQASVATRPAQPPVITQYSKNPAPNPVPVRQAGVQTQAYQQQPQQYIQQGVALQQQQLRQPQAFAAPQVQAQYPVDTSTLAPLIEQPNADTLNPQLGRQPADLAQPLPEYQNQFPAQQNFFQQPQGVQFAQPQQQQTFGQQGFQQGFGGQQQQGQLFQGFGGAGQQQQQSAFFNPFQSFLQGGNGASALDPLGLFNFGNSPFTQGAAPLARVAQTPALPSPVPAQVPQPLAQPSPAQPVYQQQPQPQFPAQPAAASSTAFTGNYNVQQPQQPAQQVPVQQQQQQQPAPIYQQPQQPYQSVQAPVPQPQAVPVQQPAQYKTNAQTQPAQQQYLQQQQNYQQPAPQQPQPLPQTSNSIDAGATLYSKYVDGKGPAPAPVAAQCPRQPGWAPCISKDLANERFRNCCARLGDGCSALCNYDATLATMQLAVLTGRCPLNKVADMMVCASGYEDATPCCEAYNVFEPGYEQCRPYCNPAAGLPQGGPLSDKYKCLAKLGAIQQCFYVTQKP